MNVTGKKHSSLKISKKLLEEYLAEGGVKILLSFVDRGSYVKLEFVGFRSDDSLCMQQDLDTVKANALHTGNIFYGMFTKDSTGVLLHDLMASVPPAQLKDWLLDPRKYKDTDERYVSYDLSPFPSSLTLNRLNPSPPA